MIRGARYYWLTKEHGDIYNLFVPSGVCAPAGWREVVVSMRIAVEEIKSEAGLHKTVPVEFTLEPVEFSGETFRFDRPFSGEAEIWNTGDELMVRARLSGEAEVGCGRCLTRFRLPLKVSFTELFREGEPTEEAEEEEGDEYTLTYYTGDQIDLTDSLRENVLLELPMQPICRKDCKGLCPTCGANLNDEACQCAAETAVDPRLAKLEELFRKPDSNS